MPCTRRSPSPAKALAVALSLLFSLAGLLAPAASSAAPQPKVKWSERRLDIEVPRGGTVSRQLTFTCDQNVRGLSVEAVPALAGLVRAQPASFASVFADQPQTVTLNFSAPADAPLGVIGGGTIHLRDASRTIPLPLNVNVKVVEGNGGGGGEDEPEIYQPVSNGTISVSGVSETTFNPRFATARFNVAGATVNASLPVKVSVNGFQFPTSGLQLAPNSVSFSPTFAEGRNDVELIAFDAQGKLLSKDVTLWAGSNSLFVSVADETGQPSTGALVTVRLGDDKEVKVASTSQSGGVTFSNVPGRTVIVEASASGNRIGSTAANGAQGSVQVRLKGFNAASAIDNNDFGLGTDGWEIGSAPVQVVPHEEGVFVPLQTAPSPPPSGFAATTQESGSFTTLDAEEGDNDLVLNTAGEGPQSISRTFAAEPGTQEVKVRYKFITTEVPGGYFGTEYNDYFNVSARTQAGGGAGTESQTMNGLGLSSFDAGGATDWREFTLPVNENGDVVQVDVTVANVADGLLDSQLVLDFVAEPKVKIGDLDAVIKDSTENVEVKMSPAGAPVTLTIEPKPGTTGAAQFVSTGSTTMTISQTTNVEIKGITESSKKNNFILKATDSDGKKLDDEDFTVLWVTITVNFSGTVSDDNSRKSKIQEVAGSLKLGLVFYGGTSLNSWSNATEYKGTVAPKDFGDEIKLIRWRINSQSYKGDGKTPDVEGGAKDDTTNKVLRDDKPSDDGHIYDYDAPGMRFLFGEPVGDIRRQRVNFREYAEYKGKKCSDEVKTYARVSVRKTTGQDALSGDVPGDDRAALGSTPTTWNLQP